MNDRIFIIAGTYDQYKQWVKENIDRFYKENTSISLSNFSYVLLPDTIKGYRNPHGFFIGTWIERHDLEPIFQQLLMATDITEKSHRTITSLWGQWKDRQ